MVGKLFKLRQTITRTVPRRSSFPASPISRSGVTGSFVSRTVLNDGARRREVARVVAPRAAIGARIRTALPRRAAAFGANRVRMG